MAINTIAVNKRTLCHKAGGGKATNTFPDICWTRIGKYIIPIPYSIVSYARDLEQGSKTVHADGGNMIGIKGSRFSKCSGDERGRIGGIISGVNKHESRFVTTSPNVKVEGKGAGRRFDLMTMNRRNTMGILHIDPVVAIKITILEEELDLCRLEVSCSHGRKAGKEKRLQVVATPTHSKSKNLGFDNKVPEPLQDELEEEYFEDAKSGALTVKMDYDGEDSLLANVIYTKGNGIKQVRCESQSETTSTINQSWTSAPMDYALQTPETERLWLAKVEPEKYEITGRGEDAMPHHIQVESYPNKKYTISLTVEDISNLPFIKTIEQCIDNVTELANKFLRNTPVKLNLEFSGPSGKLSAEWGWEEDDNWEAFYQLKGDIGINPIFEAGFGFDVSLLAVLGMFYGIPPKATHALREHLADVFVSPSFKVGCALEGGPRFRYYPARSEWKVLGEATFSATGTFTLRLTARLGSEKILSVAISGYGQAAITGSAKTTASMAGLFLHPKIKMEPLIVGVSLKLRAFFLEFEKTTDMTLVDEFDLYDGPNIKILPPGDDADA